MNLSGAHSPGFPLLTDGGHQVAKQVGAYRRTLAILRGRAAA